MRLAAVLIVVLLLVSGCSAPVKIHGYPNQALISTTDAEVCATEFENIQVLGQYPPDGNYEEIGYVDVKQKGGGVWTTSQEKQIAKARHLACEWGGDAIVILGAANKSQTSWWDGETSNTESHRIAVIKFLPEEGS